MHALAFVTRKPLYIKQKFLVICDATRQESFKDSAMYDH